MSLDSQSSYKDEDGTHPGEQFGFEHNCAKFELAGGSSISLPYDSHKNFKPKDLGRSSLPFTAVTYYYTFNRKQLRKLASSENATLIFEGTNVIWTLDCESFLPIVRSFEEQLFPGQQALTEYYNAEIAYDKGDIDSAFNYVNRAISLSPTNIYFQELLQKVKNIKNKEEQEAVKKVKETISLGKYEEAVKMARKLIDKYDKDKYWHFKNDIEHQWAEWEYNRALEFQKKMQIDRAMISINKAISLHYIDLYVQQKNDLISVHINYLKSNIQKYIDDMNYEKAKSCAQNSKTIYPDGGFETLLVSIERIEKKKRTTRLVLLGIIFAAIIVFLLIIL